MKPGETETRSGGESVQPTDHTLFVDAPARIGVFRLDVLLGRGGMGEVWRAHDTNLERDVALKLMRRELNENQEAVKRFMREARAVARLNHPNIVQIYTFGEINGAMYFVMELVEGGTVTDEIRSKGKLPPEEAVAIALQSIEGLDYALNRGIIHRDIKPSNLMIRPDGLVKIADFGLAKIRAAETQMTAAGSTMGSPNYMSPEQARGEEADHRSDMYSLGVALYQMLTGELPFTADSPLSVLLKQIQEPLPEPQYLQSMLDGRLLQIIKRMTAKHADRRYPDYREVAADLDKAVPAARTRMARSSGLSSTSSYPTPGPEYIPDSDEVTKGPEYSDADGRPYGTPPGAPRPVPASSVPPPIPKSPSAPVQDSSIPTYHREAAPQSISADGTIMESPAQKPRRTGGARLAWGAVGAALIVGIAIFASSRLKPPVVKQSDPVTTAVPTPGASPSPTTAPVPTVTPAAVTEATPSATPVAPIPTPIVIVVQAQTPAPTPDVTPEPVLATPAVTPIQTITTIERGLVAPDLPPGSAVPAREVPSGGAITIAAHTEVEIVRAVSGAGGESGYLVRAGKQELYISAANLRVETRTNLANGRAPTPATSAGGPSRTPVRTSPVVVQLGAATDTAPSVSVYRDAAGLYELKSFPRGTEVTVAATERDSYRVNLPDGRSGFVLRKSTSPQGTLPVPAP